MGRQLSGGLYGKARRVHNERRAVRLTTRELIEDYFEPQPMVARQTRFVPIRGRAEFLPGASAFEPSAEARETQLELPLAIPGDTARVEWTPSEPAREAQEKTAAAIRFPATCDALAASVSPDRAETPSTSSTSHPHPKTQPWSLNRLRRGGPFNIRGFIGGCAVGSAVAAALLFAVWLAVV